MLDHALFKVQQASYIISNVEKMLRDLPFDETRFLPKDDPYWTTINVLEYLARLENILRVMKEEEE